MSIAEQVALSQAAAAAATTEAAAPKKAAPPVTRRSTQFRIDAAKGRIVKAQETIDEATALIAELEVLFNSLPEQAPAAARTVAKVGDKVKVKQGRGVTANVADAVVTAVGTDDKGKVTRYAVQIGTGIDAEIVKVYPGQVVEVNGEAQEPEEGEDGTEGAGDDKFFG